MRPEESHTCKAYLRRNWCGHSDEGCLFCCPNVPDLSCISSMGEGEDGWSRVVASQMAVLMPWSLTVAASGRMKHDLGLHGIDGQTEIVTAPRDGSPMTAS